ncbi:MAG: ATPase [Clostridiales bacterium GWE2_32_10]|nr:MAG: ATPase [Clostridiales bacterium GWE2_32_10]
MKRKITEKLVKWKEKTNNRLPLLIYGARQVGKTYIIQEFGLAYYKNTVYVNFERMPIVSNFFDGDISPNRIIGLLESFFNEKIIPESTLIIFDEIQACERALTSLKYFAEEAPEYHIIGAGSLLGVAINRGRFSFPVGKVEMITMYPLDFEEYLLATGGKYYVDEIRKHFNENMTMPEAMHNDLIENFKKYLVIGGMPAVINEYLNTKSLVSVAETQNYILNSYIADMSKYADNNEMVKIKGTYDSIPTQLYKENTKFQYKLIKKGASANLFGASIDWLIQAGIVIKGQKVEQGNRPLVVFADLSAFKIYMSDVGLLTTKANLGYKEILSYDIISTFKGGLIENYVAQTLMASNHNIYYWESNSKAEVDFVIQTDEAIIPIEVKANTTNKSKSLDVFMERYKPDYAIRISAKNFGYANKIKSVPLYATFCI